MNHKEKLVYYDLKALDLFLNRNNNVAVIEKMTKTVREHMEASQTDDIKYLWALLESDLNKLCKRVTEIAQNARKKATCLGCKIEF